MSLLEQGKHKTGRPRSAQSHQAIIQATIELLAKQGFEAMSIEAVAERAGVGKTTIYRRWTSKADLVIDALGSLQAEMPLIDTGNIRTDLVVALHGAFQQVPVLYQSLVLQMIGVLRTNPDIFQAFHSRLVVPRLQRFMQMVDQAKARGQIRPDVDALFVVELVAGPMLYHQLLTSLISPPSATLAERVVDAVLQGIGGQAPL